MSGFRITAPPRQSLSGPGNDSQCHTITGKFVKCIKIDYLNVFCILLSHQCQHQVKLLCTGGCAKYWGLKIEHYMVLFDKRYYGG